jgi:hypothetical protein
VLQSGIGILYNNLGLCFRVKLKGLVAQESERTRRVQNGGSCEPGCDWLAKLARAKAQPHVHVQKRLESSSWKSSLSRRVIFALRSTPDR